MVECGQVDHWHGSPSWIRPFVCQIIDRGSALLSDQEIASQINSGFLQPMESFQRLEFLLSYSEDLSPLTLSEPAVLSALNRLNPMKAAGLRFWRWLIQISMVASQRPLHYTPLRTCYMYLVASHRRVWGCCESRPVWLQEGLRSQRPRPTCAQSSRPIFSSRCCPLGGRLLNA